MKERRKRAKLRKIGRGLEFTVYLLNKRRVLKRPTTRMRKRVLLKRWYKDKTFKEIIRLVDKSERGTEYSERNLQRYVLNKAPALIGNPVFLKNLAYTQDRVYVLGKYLKSHTYRQNKLILQAYVRCILQQWELGFFQKVSNFTINYGIDAKGRVILIDLGELTFSKAEVARRVRKRMWLENWSYKKFTDKKLKKYYARLLDKELTLEKLDRVWKRKR